MIGNGPRPPIAILLPPDERDPVATELAAAGFDPVPVAGSLALAQLLDRDVRVAVAIVDMERDLDGGIEAWSLLHRSDRSIPALLIVAPSELGRLDAGGETGADDEYLTRPYSAESIRWRVEAMCIRSLAVDDGAGPVLQTTLDGADWSRRGRLIAVFNPKGGVGKTTVATNLAAALVQRGSRVLLIDADTVTGHVTTSLGLDAVPTVADAWRDELEGGPVVAFPDLAATHPSGLRVLALTSSPIHTEILDPARVADAIAASRRGTDFVIVDLHPSYNAINRAVFDGADRILVPVTPDLPAIRAGLQLRDVADELGVRDRLALIVNRANSGVAVADLERTLGMPAFALLRSAGLVLVKAANEGRTVVEMAPRERIAHDFLALADRVLGTPAVVREAKAPFRLFGRAATAPA